VFRFRFHRQDDPAYSSRPRPRRRWPARPVVETEADGALSWALALSVELAGGKASTMQLARLLHWRGASLNGLPSKKSCPDRLQGGDTRATGPPGAGGGVCELPRSESAW